ncbi:MAG: insulinase family protein, partial [Candidatus Kapabacteria bacterium]|nr:insulinase family protein [Candidatus Kapabacteria bacterium]
MIHVWNRVAVCIMVGVMLASAATAQVQQHTSGKYKYTTVKNDPLGVRIYTLPNGLTVYTSVNKVEPRIQTLISVRAGSKNDPADATGLAHYLEHMVFKGTDKYGTLDFAKEKPLIDQVEQLYETYRGTRDSAQRARIYRSIDSVSGLAAKYSIASEYDKMVSALGAKGTNAHTASEETVYENDIPANQLRNWLQLEAERFRNPVLRLFHTELEAVYEEKNRTLDNDSRQSYEKLMAGLFKKHTYGTQTTIGTIEHLKNPSMKKIREYYNTYYVPNNMAIILCGDFNPDEAIAMIDETFGKYAPKPVPVFTPAVEDPITSPTVIEVFGPSAEQVRFAYRFPGVASPDVKLLTMCDMILSNSQTGLIDLNIKQKQKALNAGCSPTILKDYSYHTFSGSPRKGQKLEDVVNLLLEQIEELKKGNFDETMMKAIVTNMRIQQTKQLESNESRANALSSCFIEGRNWNDDVTFFDELAKITKQQVVDFAKKNYNTNYVVVYKRTGENKNIQKVPKPPITPVTINKDQSPFVKAMLEQLAKTDKINPKFSDFRNDIARASTNGIQIFAVRNTENDLFTLQYVWDMGTRHDKKSALAAQYMDLVGTAAMNADQLKQKFYEIGCSMDARVGNDQITIEISGINSAMNEALKLTDDVLLRAKPDDQSLKLMVEGMLKQRADARKNKGVVLNQALANYVQYGKRNPFTDIMSEQELRAITAAD